MEYLKAFYAGLRAMLAVSVIGSSPASLRAQPLDPEEQAWQAAQGQGTPEAFQSYLDAYPAGRHATAAFREVVTRSLGSRSTGANPKGGAAADDGRRSDLY